MWHFETVGVGGEEVDVVVDVEDVVVVQVFTDDQRCQEKFSRSG